MSTNLSLNALFEEKYCLLTTFCHRHVSSSLGDPEEFVHLAFIKCSRCWREEFASESASLAYIYQSLRWIISDAIRRRRLSVAARHHGTVCDSSTTCSPLESLIAEEALHSLRNKELDVCLATLAGKTREQIQRDLNMSAGALSVCLSRAKSTLIRKLRHQV